MKLFKNVDIEDIKAIAESGILPIAKTGNDWNNGNRVNNSKEVVYLFQAATTMNTFTQYGIVLVEVEVEATENKLEDNDCNKGLYTEFVAAEVKPEQIKKIYIPEIFKGRVSELVDGIDVTYVKMTADKDEATVERFAKTANLSTNDFNFFRGLTEERHMIDLENVKYEI